MFTFCVTCINRKQNILQYQRNDFWICIFVLYCILLTYNTKTFYSHAKQTILFIKRLNFSPFLFFLLAIFFYRVSFNTFNLFIFKNYSSTSSSLCTRACVQHVPRQSFEVFILTVYLSVQLLYYLCFLGQRQKSLRFVSQIASCFVFLLYVNLSQCH